MYLKKNQQKKTYTTTPHPKIHQLCVLAKVENETQTNQIFALLHRMTTVTSELRKRKSNGWHLYLTVLLRPACCDHCANRAYIQPLFRCMRYIICAHTFDTCLKRKVCQKVGLFISKPFSKIEMPPDGHLPPHPVPLSHNPECVFELILMDIID